MEKLPTAKELADKEAQRIIAGLEDEKTRRKMIKSLPGKLKFALDPVAYAEGAISCIEDQLKTVKSKKRKQKLEVKLEHWRKALATLEQV